MTTPERQLERSDPDQATRCRLLAALVAELAGEDDPQAVQLCAEAMLAHVEGRFEDAHRHYAEATAQMRRNGSLHADAFHGLARLTIELGEGHAAAAEPLARALREMTGPLAADAWAVTLAAGLPRPPGSSGPAFRRRGTDRPALELAPLDRPGPDRRQSLSTERMTEGQWAG